MAHSASCGDLSSAGSRWLGGGSTHSLRLIGADLDDAAAAAPEDAAPVVAAPVRAPSAPGEAAALKEDRL
jgi:hypothetical protein